MSPPANHGDAPIDVLGQRLDQSLACVTALWVSLAENEHDQGGLTVPVMANLAWSAYELLKQADAAFKNIGGAS